MGVLSVLPRLAGWKTVEELTYQVVGCEKKYGLRRPCSEGLAVRNLFLDVPTECLCLEKRIRSVVERVMSVS